MSNKLTSDQAVEIARKKIDAIIAELDEQLRRPKKEETTCTLPEATATM